MKAEANNQGKHFILFVITDQLTIYPVKAYNANIRIPVLQYIAMYVTQH